MGLKVALFTLVILAAVVAIALWAGAARWQRQTQTLRGQLLTARQTPTQLTYDARATAGLPAPVQRYFQTVLPAGQPLIRTAWIRTEGDFVLGETRDNWHSFRAHQQFTVQPPGFDWDARINMAPGVTAFVRDAYVAGRAMLHAEALGLITVADQRHTPELAQGELLRYLAEAVWFPTALLPGQGVEWEAIDATRARATLTDGATTVWLEFRFGEDGLVESIWTPIRYGTFQGQLQQMPWQGSFRNYQEREGILVPIESEVAWLLPAGDLPYWRGRITEIAYEYAQ